MIKQFQPVYECPYKDLPLGAVHDCNEGVWRHFLFVKKSARESLVLVSLGDGIREGCAKFRPSATVTRYMPHYARARDPKDLMEHLLNEQETDLPPSMRID